MPKAKFFAPQALFLALPRCSRRQNHALSALKITWGRETEAQHKLRTGHDVSTAKICVRCCWDGPPGAFLMVSAGSPHLPGWLGHWGYAPLALQVPLAELPTTAPDIGPPDGGWWARARGARRHPPGPACRSLAPRPAPFRLVWPGGRMRAACAGFREPLNRRSSLVTTYTHDSLWRANRGGLWLGAHFWEPNEGKAAVCWCQEGSRRPRDWGKKIR